MRQHHFIKSDGLDLAVEEFGHGKPFIFAHGLSGNRHGSYAQLQPLADRYRVIIYDQRGHCDSTPVTDPALYDINRMAEDMTAVLDSYGIDRAIVGGESMGVATTMVFALKHPERIEKIVFTAPAFGDQPNSEGERLRDMGKLIAQVGMEKFLDAAAIRQRDDLGWSPETIAYVRANFSSHQAASLATALQTTEAWTPFANLSVFSRITCPVLILAWEQDPLHPYELAERYAKVFPNATLQKVPPLPAIFLNPTLVGQAYREFLERS